ncbi:receptor-like protein 46 [Quercus suber]|uniref:receptor-like protein 46 n=1 Tax=Quercus suber TaxID=58331 RepID=UPI0032DF2139
MAKLSLLLLLVLGLLILFTPSLSCPEHQKQALLQFKASLINATTSFSPKSPLALLESWNSSLDCCHWDMVNCSSRFDSRNVGSLYLEDLIWSKEPIVLSSTILTPLFRIRSLTHLVMSWNQIQGELPGDGFANLTELVHLDLWNNDFNGSIPSQLFHLKHLQYLDISFNSFQGKIPKEIGNMTKLQHLILRSNKLFGEIPSSILNLKELKTMDLSYNSLSMEIPVDIGNLANMTNLDLNCNKLTGTIPTTIQNLTKLEKLHLESNLLVGDIPSRLFIIKGLKSLLLGGNNLTWNNNAKMVPKFTLSELSMRSCGLTGEIPGWISTQKTLEILDLSENQLEGMFPQWLAEMEVGTIILSDNNLTGPLPPRLFNSQKLRSGLTNRVKLDNA